VSLLLPFEDHSDVVGRAGFEVDGSDADQLPSFIAEAVLVPSEAMIGDQMLIVDPEAIFAARERLRRDIGQELEHRWREAHSSASALNRYEYSPAGKGARRLRTVALGYLAASGAQDAPTGAITPSPSSAPKD
jgi:aminopeptidase N